MEKKGKFSQSLEKSRSAALALYDKISTDKRFYTIMPPELDIVVWAPAASRASTISNRSSEIFRKAEQASLHLAVFKYPSDLLKKLWTDVEFDQPDVTCLRACLMKPEHLEWMDRIWEILDKVAGD